MRSPQTLFIIGAGGSGEVDMPTGMQLIDIIARKLDYQLVNGSRRHDFGDDDILDIFQQHTPTRAPGRKNLRPIRPAREAACPSPRMLSEPAVHFSAKGLPI
jgi:hypothetical protein